MPELPQARRARYVAEYRLSAYDAAVIVSSGGDYFDAAVRAGGTTMGAAEAKRAASLYSKIALRELKSNPALLSERDPAQLARVSALIATGELTSQNAEQVYARHLQDGLAVDAIVAELGLRSISDRGALAEAIERVVAANPNAVADYAGGKTQAVKFLVGQVMKETRGQADAATVQQLLEERLAQ
jgi:aspartyl-tRNA(Asn)/glutamyl-tRNA(Gln) amidotransferase subunit B